MELSDPAAIQALLFNLENAPAGTTKTAEPEGQPRRRGPRGDRYCRCGKCATCRDNAKWNRIFAEKFEDPTYYARRSVRHYSPLS